MLLQYFMTACFWIVAFIPFVCKVVVLLLCITIDYSSNGIICYNMLIFEKSTEYDQSITH